ncbi:MAG: AIPR family protein [Polaromonas sp.]|uniref:AIPR family protein n=1 Tax=Polaromonas sp. TaxID=1869339 RepID=UPI0025FFCA1A|nr:AIPR family protein [Polaromonas sp.]MBI2727794.1 AIPR family protein [Polaromonas sp.]
MATLLDWNALETKLQTYKEQYDCENVSAALPCLVLEYALAIDPEEVEDSITDGGDDRGVDAVYVDSREGSNVIHLFQFKHVTTFEKSKNNFPSNEIDKLLSFCADLLENAPGLKKTCNAVLWEKVQQIWDALQKPNPSFEIHLAGNMQSLLLAQKKRLEGALKKYRSFSIYEHTLESIVAMLLQHKHVKVDAHLQLVDTNYFERTDGNIRGLICTVEAQSIVRLIADESREEVNAAVFNDNVRVYLTKKNQINRKIISSVVSDKNSEFWYLNNGITMTCDSFAYQAGQRAPLVTIKNLQIVNGGQTSNALFEANREHPDKVKTALVLVRIYETKTKEISNKIAESTNSQTPINTRDLRSNDEIQKTLESTFLDLGYYYERKAKMHAEAPKAARIDALVAGQVCLAYHLCKPEVAKKDRSRVFSDLYDEVFNEGLTPKTILTPLKVLEKIEEIKRDLQRKIRKQEKFDPDKRFLIDGAYHVLYAVHALCVHREIDPFDQVKAFKLIEEATKIVSDLVKAEVRADDGFSFNRFFKDAKTRIKIDGAISSHRLRKITSRATAKSKASPEKSIRKTKQSKVA